MLMCARHQIIIFLTASVVSVLASIICLYLTASEVYHHCRLTNAAFQFFASDSCDDCNSSSSRIVVTVNVLVTVCLELGLSMASFLVALKGSLSHPYNFEAATSTKVLDSASKA